MEWSRRQFLATATSAAALPLLGCSTATPSPRTRIPGAAAPSDPATLLIVRQKELMAGPSSGAVAQQRVWTMHETGLSRSALLTLEGGMPLVARPGRAMFIVLAGTVRFDFLDRQEMASIGAYADIPAGVAFQMVPINVSPPVLVSFEVPKFAFDTLSTGPFGPESASATAVSNRDTLMATTPT
ncbi:hypothetical protein [Rhodococcus koreensis]